MPRFLFHLRAQDALEPDDIGLECRDLDEAYLEACRAIPGMAADLLLKGRNPILCAFVICDHRGRQLMDVPFAEILPPAAWNIRRPGPRATMHWRSSRARDDLALQNFRRTFGALNVGCVLMTPELEVTEMNEFGARHSHVDPEEIRGRSILDIFVDLRGKPKDDFRKFMMLARAGAISEIVDLPYHVLDERGQSTSGWWNARTWPIFDEDDRILGLVEWAEPFTRATAGGRTVLRIAPALAS